MSAPVRDPVLTRAVGILETFTPDSPALTAADGTGAASSPQHEEDA